MSQLEPSKSKDTAGNKGGIMPWNNSPLIKQFRQDLDQIVNRFFGDLPSLANMNQKHFWGIDLDDKEDAVTVRFDAPGFELKDIELKLNGNELILRAAHKSETKDKDRSEQHQSSLYRSVMLPQGFIADKAEAKFQNGLLTVTFPKSGGAQGKRIAIQGQ